MTEYRTDRKRELRENLERLADEETLDQNALAQMAKDLEITSQAEAAEARLRVRGVDAVKREDREEARKCVDNLLKKAKDAARDKQLERKQLYQIASKIAKVVGIVATGLAVIGVPVYTTAHYWNTRDEALEALAKYDKPTRISDLEERAEIISQLDEIIEEHADDADSDIEAADYLKQLESRRYSISEGAKALDKIGQYYNNTDSSWALVSNTIEYLDSFRKNPLDPTEEKCLMGIARTMSDYRLVENVKNLRAEGYCK